MEHAALHLHEIVIFLAATSIIVPICRRFHLSSVLGYLIIGILVGPFGLGSLSEYIPWLSYITISDVEAVRSMGHLGILFLFFMVGLGLSLDRLLELKRYVFGLGAMQVLITACVIGVIAYMFGNSINSSVVLGLGLALSSTAIVVQLLQERWQLNSGLGRVSFSVLLFQDLAVVPLLVLLGMLGSDGEAVTGNIYLTLIEASAKALLAIILIVGIGRILIRPLFKLIGASYSRELFVAATLLIIVFIGMVMEQVGMSMAIGAFLAGLLLSETKYRHEIELDIEPFKGLLLGLFIMSVGMGIDLTSIADKPFWLLVSVIGLFLIKGAIIIPLALLFRISLPIALEMGLLLGQAGEFAFIMIGVSLDNQLLPPDTAQFMLLVVSLTMLVTPLVAKLGREVGNIVDKWQNEGERPLEICDPSLYQGHILICGYGRTGQILGDILHDEQISFVGLDMDTQVINKYFQQDIPVYYGDATRKEMLEAAAIGQAKAVVVTVDSASSAENVTRIVKRFWPNIPIYVRAENAEHAEKLARMGVHSVVFEALECSFQFGEELLALSGMPTETAQSVIQQKRIKKMALIQDLIHQN